MTPRVTPTFSLILALVTLPLLLQPGCKKGSDRTKSFLEEARSEYCECAERTEPESVRACVAYLSGEWGGRLRLIGAKHQPESDYPELWKAIHACKAKAEGAAGGS